MFNRQQRFVVSAVAAIVVIWLLAFAGHAYLQSRKMTADKVRAYVESVDFGKLTGADRAKALKELEDKLNALSYEERRRLRGEHLIRGWFDQMTDDEKNQFVEATMPTGFKQMIDSFQQLPEDKRHQMIDRAMKNLQRDDRRNDEQQGTNGPPQISPELEAKIRTIGLKTFYSQSSAQTKAELAPLLEEMQRQMESGRVLQQQ